MIVNETNIQSPPVLLLIFNRIDTVREVIEALKNVKPSRIYIAADGARKDKDEDSKVEIVRKYVLKHIDWPCELKTLFRDENLGCKTAVSSAIDWFFSYEEEGIILEDDTVPNESFFYFCGELLHRYRSDDRVMHISGTNFQDGLIRGDGTYYFSNYAHVWGWATWKRAWEHYDVNMKNLPSFLVSNSFNEKNISESTKKYMRKVFLKIYDNKIDTWDYQWLYTIWKRNGVSITPNINLISNIGFGKDATHTKNDFSNVSNLGTSEFDSIETPSSTTVDIKADEYVSKKFFIGTRKKVVRIIRILMKKVGI